MEHEIAQKYVDSPALLSVSALYRCVHTGALAGGAPLTSSEDLSDSFFLTNSRPGTIVLEEKEKKKGLVVNTQSLILNSNLCGKKLVLCKTLQAAAEWAYLQH